MYAKSLALGPIVVIARVLHDLFVFFSESIY